MNAPAHSEPVLALPPSWYASAHVFAAEQEHIFAREWTIAGPASALKTPGAWISLRIAGKSVVIVRGDDGALHGHLNVCRHRASSLVNPDNAMGDCRALSCPYHGWVYELDGSLRAAPGFDTSESFSAPAWSLVPVKVDIWNGIVFACLDADAPALNDWLGAIKTIANDFVSPEQLEFHSRVDSDGDADWKVYSDNSAEGYHLSYVHPDLSAAVDDSTTVEPWPDGRFVGFDVRYRDGHGGRGFWVYKFPGILLHFSEHGFNMERVVPTGAGTIQMQRWFWGETDADAAVLASAVTASSQVMAEDLAVCEQVQRNLNSGAARQGLLSPEREPGTIYFQELVRESLAAVPALPDA